MEDAAREAVDLDDQQSAAAGRGRRTDAAPAHEAIDETLQREHEVVEGHAALDCMIEGE